MKNGILKQCPENVKSLDQSQDNTVKLPGRVPVSSR